MATTSPKEGGGPSKMATEAMCMWDTGSSMWRNEAFKGLRRSGLIDPPFNNPPREAQTSPGWCRVLGSAGGRGSERGPERGEGGSGEDQLAGLLVGRLDDLRAP